MAINLPSDWAYRSPQRNKYCRGPILAYWPRKLSAHEFLLQRKKKNQLINESFFSLARLCNNSGYRFKLVNYNNQTNYFNRWRKSFPFTCPSLLSKSASVSSGLPTRRHVRNFCSHQTQTPPTHKDTPLPDDSPVGPHSPDTLPCPTAGERIHPHPGQVGRWKVEIGFRQRWVAARCSTAQPLLFTPLPWETNRRIYCNIHNRCEHSNSALYILDTVVMMLSSV